MKENKRVKSNLPYYFWYIANLLYRLKIPFLPFMIQQIPRVLFCCYIPYKAKIGTNVHFGHLGMGVVLSEKVVVGNNVRIDQHVTIGGRVGPIHPVLGNNIRIGAGAKVLGAITIGDNSQVGANAVVVKDVPPNVTVVGIPAKIVRRRD